MIALPQAPFDKFNNWLGREVADAKRLCDGPLFCEAPCHLH